MSSVFQGILRSLLGLGLCILAFVIARYGGAQPHGAETGEYIGVALAVLALAIWAWRTAPPAHGAAEITANIIRHGLTITGVAVTAVICLIAALVGAWLRQGG